MWTISASITTTATPSQIWSIYLDFPNWPQWDHGLASYKPDGPFATSTHGTLQPTGGPTIPFSLDLVKPQHTFVDRTPLGPNTVLIGRHQLTALPDGTTQITHTVEIEGPNAADIAQQMGFNQSELLETVTNLAHYTEERYHAQ
jgi:hypothetical protein